jgi:tetratricopeptide (TPR) repeat protein
VSATDADGAVKVPGRRARRWYRSLWFQVLAALLVLLAGGGIYLRFHRAGPEPPGVDREGIDPAVVAAVEHARQGVLRAPRSADAWGRLGMVFMAHEFRAQASFCLAQAEGLDLREPRWPYFQALTLLRAGDTEAALPKLEQAVALWGDERDTPRVWLAEILLSLRHLDEAEQHFRRLLKRMPGHPRAQLGLARLVYQRGDPRASLVYLDLPQKDQRTRKAACLLLAEVEHRLGNKAAAEQAQRRAAGLPEDRPWPDPIHDEITALRAGKDAWLAQARAFVSQGDDAAALALLQRTTNDYPDSDEAWLLLGQMFLIQKNPPAAERALRRATELAPRAHQNVFYLGTTLFLRGDVAGAMACCRKAVELKPDFAPAHHVLGNCLVQTGKQAGAIDAYRAAVRCDLNLFEAHVALAGLLAENGQKAEAVVHARHAARLRPSDPAVRQLEQRLGRLSGSPSSQR